MYCILYYHVTIYARIDLSRGKRLRPKSDTWAREHVKRTSTDKSRLREDRRFQRESTVAALSATFWENFKILQLPPRDFEPSDLSLLLAIRSCLRILVVPSVCPNMWTHHHQRATIFQMYWPSAYTRTPHSLVRLSFLLSLSSRFSVASPPIISCSSPGPVSTNRVQT